MLKAANLEDISFITHGFATRQGGVSQGRYSSLNCGPGSDDDPQYVEENRSRALRMADMANARLLSCYQIHGNHVIHATEDWGSNRPKGDAMITDRPHLVLGILTADCAPILFADEEKSIIGAAHAGWRGALAEIGLATLKKMRTLGAKNIRAAIGPTISQSSYEVGPEFPNPFLAKDKANEKFFAPASKPDHFLFDLPGFLLRQLQNECKIIALERDTLKEEELFFSNRRTFLNGGGDYGRQISIIGLS